jgi:23S rRNA pseudouridine1911/1915/1917 synthase
VKHSIVGDPIYGQEEKDILRFLDKEITLDERIKRSGAHRLMLHASGLGFTLYEKNYAIKSTKAFLHEVNKLVN